MSDRITITVALEVDVDQDAWRRLYAASDEYDEGQAKPARSLVADVRDYCLGQIVDSAAAVEGAIYLVDLVRGRRRGG